MLMLHIQFVINCVKVQSNYFMIYWSESAHALHYRLHQNLIVTPGYVDPFFAGYEI